MRKNKSGEPPIPKSLWSLKASMHRMFADELLGIAKAAGAFGEALLQSTINRHIALAEASDELCSKVAKGRPKAIKAVVDQLAVVNHLVAMLPMRKTSPKKPGRPRQDPDVDMNALTYRVVEQKRTVLAKNNTTKPTITAAIDSINTELARDDGVQLDKLDKAVLDAYETVHAAYNRGKRQAKGKGQN